MLEVAVDERGGHLCSVLLTRFLFVVEELLTIGVISPQRDVESGGHLFLDVFFAGLLHGLIPLGFMEDPLLDQ